MKSYIKLIDALENGDALTAEKYIFKARKFLSKYEFMDYYSRILYLKGRFLEAKKYAVDDEIKLNVLFKLDRVAQAQKLLKKINDKNERKLYLAGILRKKGKYKKAIEILRGIKPASCDVEWLMGACYRKINLKESLKHFKKALKLSVSILDEGFSLCGIGGVLRELGKVKESLEAYKKANRIFKKLDNAYGVAYSYCGIGNAYAVLKEKRSAYKNYEKSIYYYKLTGDKNSILDVKNRIKYLDAA